MSARRACCLIRQQVHYRRDAFLKGLAAAGYDVRSEIKDPASGDVLLIWNRYGHFAREADRFEAGGATVLVVENGYIRVADSEGRQSYAISRGQHHHGYAAPDLARLAKLTFAPWREAGDHILVCGQRGIGSLKMASPVGWEETAAYNLRKQTGRKVVVRKHPEARGALPPRPLADDLASAHACVVWSSCAGLGALLAGVPVFYAAPDWIGRAAAYPLADADIESPFLGARYTALATALSNQYSIAEITSGQPFRTLAA
jgi:hypothetical protein